MDSYGHFRFLTLSGMGFTRTSFSADQMVDGVLVEDVFFVRVSYRLSVANAAS